MSGCALILLACIHPVMSCRDSCIFHPSTSSGSFGSSKQAAPCMQARIMLAHLFYLGIDDFDSKRSAYLAQSASLPKQLYAKEDTLNFQYLGKWSVFVIFRCLFKIYYQVKAHTRQGYFQNCTYITMDVLPRQYIISLIISRRQTRSALSLRYKLDVTSIAAQLVSCLTFLGFSRFTTIKF